MAVHDLIYHSVYPIYLAVSIFLNSDWQLWRICDCLSLVFDILVAAFRYSNPYTSSINPDRVLISDMSGAGGHPRRPWVSRNSSETGRYAAKATCLKSAPEPSWWQCEPLHRCVTPNYYCIYNYSCWPQPQKWIRRSNNISETGWSYDSKFAFIFFIYSQTEDDLSGLEETSLTIQV